jgi:riboflavin synthase
MFTGLIEAVGRVADVNGTIPPVRVRIRTTVAKEMHPGDSLAVNGVCLTVVAAEGEEVEADIGVETARVTTLGTVRIGQAVNLERSMRADGRFGGHFVQGHVDGIGIVTRVRVDGENRSFTISFEAAVAAYLISKGAITVDGVSLTISRLGNAEFDVMVIPYTWEHTTLRELRPGDRVNLEFDMVGKYVVRTAELARADADALRPAVK